VSAFAWRFSSDEDEGPAAVGGYIDSAPSTTTNNTAAKGYANAPNGGSNAAGAGGTAEGRTMQLITGSTDTRIRVYDLLLSSSSTSSASTSSRTAAAAAAGKPIHVLEGHVSVVRGLDVSPSGVEGRGKAGRWLVSAGRDRVGLVWDLEPPAAAGAEKGMKKVKAGVPVAPRVVQTLLASESLETIGLLSPSHTIGNGIRERETLEQEQQGGAERGRLICYTGGEKGRVRLWDVLKGKEVGGVPGLDVEDLQDGEEREEDDEQQGLAFVL
jgi:U3 small nucleolar RNA-associated protein 13